MAIKPDPRAAAVELLERAIAGVSIIVIDAEPALDPLAAGVAAIGRIYHSATRPARARSKH